MILLLLLIITYIAFISLGLPDGLLGASWPTIKIIMDLPKSYAGIVSMCIAGGTIVSSFFSDKIIRKFGTSIVTFISVLMTACALLGFSFSTKFYHLILCAIPLGLGAGSVDAALNNFVALKYSSKHMNWLHAFWGIGALLGPIIMGYFLEKGYVFQKGYQVVSIIQFVLVLLLIFFLPIWKKEERKEKSIDDKVIDKKHFRINNLIKLPGAKAILIAFFCYCALEATFGLWTASYAVDILGISAEKAAKWASLFYIGITVGRFLSGFISFRINSKKLVYYGLAIIAIGILLILINITNEVTLVGLISVGIGCSPIFPNLLHQTPDNFGKEYSQSIMGIQMAAAYIGTTVMPPIFGVIAGKFTIKLLPLYGLILLVLMIVMINLLNSKTKKLET